MVIEIQPGEDVGELLRKLDILDAVRAEHPTPGRYRAPEASVAPDAWDRILWSTYVAGAPPQRGVRLPSR